jgi:hypothetical protein
MSQWGSLPPDRVPTLTEVVDWPETVQPVGGRPLIGNDPPPVEANFAAAQNMSAQNMSAQNMSAQNAPMQPAFDISEEQIVERVFGEVQRQVDLMLEYRMREVLTPVLTRVADQIIREARGELASTLRDVVARAVAQEIARHRTR